MLFEFCLNTPKEGFTNITRYVRDAVSKSGVKSGFCIVFCPHTTAGITINENADPDVAADLLLALAKTCPDQPEFLHREGNSSAHLKSSMIGATEIVIVENGTLLLGTWQGLYFTEFDGPRVRKFFVRITECA
jgi:secondary thiamine-phosphate synthase enzyme